MRFCSVGVVTLGSDPKVSCQDLCFSTFFFSLVFTFEIGLILLVSFTFGLNVLKRYSNEDLRCLGLIYRIHRPIVQPTYAMQERGST